MRDELLAGAGLAAHEHGDVLVRDARRRLQASLQRRALTYHADASRLFQRHAIPAPPQIAGLAGAAHAVGHLVVVAGAITLTTAVAVLPASGRPSEPATTAVGYTTLAATSGPGILCTVAAICTSARGTV